MWVDPVIRWLFAPIDSNVDAQGEGILCQKGNATPSSTWYLVLGKALDSWDSKETHISLSGRNTLELLANHHYGGVIDVIVTDPCGLKGTLILPHR